MGARLHPGRLPVQRRRVGFAFFGLWMIKELPGRPRLRWKSIPAWRCFVTQRGLLLCPPRRPPPHDFLAGTRFLPGKNPAASRLWLEILLYSFDAALPRPYISFSSHSSSALAGDRHRAKAAVLALIAAVRRSGKTVLVGLRLGGLSPGGGSMIHLVDLTKSGLMGRRATRNFFQILVR